MAIPSDTVTQFLEKLHFWEAFTESYPCLSTDGFWSSEVSICFY